MRAGKRGFTLLEIMVAVGILAVLTMISVSQFQSGRHNEFLVLASQRMGEAFQSAESYARAGSSEKYSNAQAFGVHIDKENGTYFLFSDEVLHEGLRGVWDGPGGSATSTDRMIEAQPRAIDEAQTGGVIITDITADGVVLTASSTDIAYLPRNGGLLINGSASSTVLEIILKNPKNTNALTNTRRITLNRVTGRVDIEY